MNAILIIFICQSFSTSLGVTYTVKGTNQHRTQAQASYECSSHEPVSYDPENPVYDSCVDLGCTSHGTL